MGLMDTLIKGLKDAAETIDKQAGLSGDNSIGNMAAKAEQVYHETVEGGSVEQPSSFAKAAEQSQQTSSSQPAGNTIHQAESSALGGDYQIADGNGMSYEVPVEFEDFDSGALEIQLSYMYPDDPQSPSIFVQEIGGGLPSVKEPVTKGIMEYSSGGWLTWRGSRLKYYGFRDRQGNEKLLIVTASNDESVNAMLEAVLDHAAMTFKLNG